MKVKTTIVKKAQFIPAKNIPAVTRRVFEINESEAIFIRSLLGPLNGEDLMKILKKSTHYRDNAEFLTEAKVQDYVASIYQCITNELRHRA